MVSNSLAINGYLLENEMRKEKPQDIRHDWLPKDSPKDPKLIMKKHTLP